MHMYMFHVGLNGGEGEYGLTFIGSTIIQNCNIIYMYIYIYMYIKKYVFTYIHINVYIHRFIRW
jgi:hypothetical protein